MAASTFHYDLEISKHSAVIPDLPPHIAVSNSIIEIRLKRGFLKLYRNTQGQLNVIHHRITAPERRVSISIPFRLLCTPLDGPRYVSNQLLRQNVDPFTCDYLTHHIVHYAVDLSEDETESNSNWISIMVNLEVTEVEVFDARHELLRLERLRSRLSEMAILLREQGNDDSVRRGASESAIQGLKKQIFDGEDDSCVVCLEKFCAGTEYTRMPCHHLFHHGCIIQWLEKSNTCPTCRFALED